MNTDRAPAQSAAQTHPYAGMWVTADGHVRHNLLADGRYDEARGRRESAYQGRYEVRGDEIFYWDDTGFTADGRFIDGVLHHGGMILHRRE
ncbi:Atu4866 domain-containing protein [Chelatococcus reniformis]|nr:Atu4866 domain-containing protein [Chelatococcus reniformis]